MTRMKRGSRKRTESTAARAKGEAEREAKQYAGAFARVRLVRAWVGAVAAIAAMLSGCVPLLERLLKWWATLPGRRAPRRSAVLAASYLLGVLALLVPGPVHASLTADRDKPSRSRPSVSLSHDGGGTASVNTNASSSTTFTLTSLSVSTLTVNLVVTVCNGSLAAASCTSSPTSVSLPSSGSTGITVNFDGGSAAGTGTITLTAKNTSGSTLAFASVTVTVSKPLPTVDPAPHLGNRRDVSLCVVDCFESTLAYSTPAYVSLDVPRSVTLLYRSGRAYPHGTLTLDVTDPYATATKFRLKLKDSTSGAYEQFSNGGTELYFTRNPSGPTRIVAQFPATTIPTSAAMYVAEVTMFWGTAEQGTASANVRIIVINDRISPLGAGVDVVGLQRVFTTQSGGVLVTDGSGSASFFAGTCSPSVVCDFTSPTGDFSKLATTGTGYRRTYPDSTKVTFNATGLGTSVADRFGTTTTVSYGTSSTGSPSQSPSPIRRARRSSSTTTTRPALARRTSTEAWDRSASSKVLACPTSG